MIISIQASDLDLQDSIRVETVSVNNFEWKETISGGRDS